MSHDDAFAAFQARRNAERAAAVKVTWRKVDPMTGGGWSALGRDGALGFVAPRDPEHGDYAWGDLNQDVRPWRRNVVGRELTLARAKAAVEKLLTESACKTSLADSCDTSIVHAVNNVPSHFTGGINAMQTKITALTANQVQAINEVLPGVETTASTATFNQDAAAALADVQAAMADLPSTGHPRQSLHAVVRELKAQAAKQPAAVTAPIGTEVTEQLVAGLENTNAAEPQKEATVARTTTSKPKPETTEGITAEQFAGSIEGVEAVRAAKAPTARLRANGKTLAYADDRKGGFNLSIAAEAVESAPAKVKGLVEIKGRRANLRVDASNVKKATTVVAWLAKQVA